MECYFLLLVNRFYIRQPENILASHYLHAYRMKDLVLPLLCCSVILVHACEHGSSLHLTPCIAIDVLLVWNLALRLRPHHILPIHKTIIIVSILCCLWTGTRHFSSHWCNQGLYSRDWKIQRKASSEGTTKSCKFFSTSVNSFYIPIPSMLVFHMHVLKPKAVDTIWKTG